MKLKRVICITILSLAGFGVSPAVTQVSYEYDERGRLKGAAYANGGLAQIILDAAGNRTALDVSGVGLEDPDPAGQKRFAVVPLVGLSTLPVK